MNRQEAEKIIEALQGGRSFEFSNYHGGTREVLEYDSAGTCFVYTTYYAYDPDVLRECFNLDEFSTWLQDRFSFSGFDLSTE